MPNITLIKLTGHTSGTATSHIIRVVNTILIRSYPQLRVDSKIIFSETTKGESIIALSVDKAFPHSSSVAPSMQKMIERILDETYAECTKAGIPSLVINKPTQAKMALKRSYSRHIRSQINKIRNIEEPPTWLKLEATTGYAIKILIGSQSTLVPPEEVACLSITSRAKARTGEVYRLRTSSGQCSVVMEHSYCRLTLQAGMLVTTRRINGQISRAVVSVVQLQPNLFDLE